MLLYLILFGSLCAEAAKINSVDVAWLMRVDGNPLFYPSSNSSPPISSFPPRAGFDVGSMTYFWSEEALPLSTSCALRPIFLKDFTWRSRSYCGTADQMHTCNQTVTTRVYYSEKFENLNLHWLCPRDKNCCQWECCTDEKSWVGYLISGGGILIIFSMMSIVGYKIITRTCYDCHVPAEGEYSREAPRGPERPYRYAYDPEVGAMRILWADADLPQGGWGEEREKPVVGPAITRKEPEPKPDPLMTVD